MAVATYRERLRVEGLTLAGFGGAVCAILLAGVDGATDRPASTVGQLSVVLAAMTVLGLLGVRRAVRDSGPLPAGRRGSGEPTPLWQLPVIVIALTLLFGLLAGWDAGLRIAGGCVIVGLVQALVLERAVAGDELRTGRRHVRVAGSRILRGSRLAHVAADA